MSGLTEQRRREAHLAIKNTRINALEAQLHAANEARALTERVLQDTTEKLLTAEKLLGAAMSTQGVCGAICTNIWGRC